MIVCRGDDTEKLDVEGPMMNPLTVKCAEAKSSFDLNGNSNGGINGGNKNKLRTYNRPDSDDVINKLIQRKFAMQSKKKMNWCIGMYDQWRSNRLLDAYVPDEIRRANLNALFTFSAGDLEYSLCRFVREVKKVDGTDFPPNTVRELVILIQMHLNENSIYWKLLDGDKFPNLRNVVDNTMKERTAMGLGVRRSSSVISLDSENKMFDEGILGEDNPTKLLETVIYMVGLHLALRGGVEHSHLRRPGFDPQIIVEKDDCGKKRLVYREDPLQKTNQGGLVCKRTNKVVYVYESASLRKCPVRLYEKYIGLLPEPKSCRKLYMRPRMRCSPKVWYCDQPYGVNKVSSTVKKLCKSACLQGKFTSHSLRATSASRMYQSDVPEQVIKEVTGHKSDCVRIYKRTTDDIREKASKTLSGEINKESNMSVVNVEAKQNSSIKSNKVTELKELRERDKQNLSVVQMIRNVIKTRMELRKKKSNNLSKVVSKLVKRGRLRVGQVGLKSKAKSAKVASDVDSGDNKRIVLDLNVNFNVSK